ncbi:unnamed protein product [Rotaria sordida]|uniref:Uncharacterized protein n=1 Tax=Rotaria sordida TaxID=392033 RepID=A0A815S3S5_9BILA|nr:unnamed protein product [Rotaria sordida]CAF1485688.1 unnamed protein product [Rotaria sordida]
MWVPLYPPVVTVPQQPPSYNLACSTNNKPPQVPYQNIAVYPTTSIVSFQPYPYIIANPPVDVVSQERSKTTPMQTTTALQAQSQRTSRHYQVREKIFSLGDNFKINDDLGNHVFTVRSKFLSIGDHLILEDPSGL